MNETANEMNEWENEHMRHKMTKRRRNKKKKRKKSKSDMIEWEIDETYTECENERRMSGHMNKEMKGSFIYRNENRNYTSLDRGCSGFYPTTWNFDSSNPFYFSGSNI